MRKHLIMEMSTCTQLPEVVEVLNVCLFVLFLLAKVSTSLVRESRHSILLRHNIVLPADQMSHSADMEWTVVFALVVLIWGTLGYYAQTDTFIHQKLFVKF